MKSFKAYRLVEAAAVTTHQEFKKDMDKTLSGHSTFSHGPHHNGWLHKSGKEVPIEKVHKTLLKHGFRVSHPERQFSHAKVTSYHRTPGPYQDHSVSIESKDGKTAWHVTSSTHVDHS